MISRILVCTDGSSCGETACAYGLYMAKALNAKLSALHVLDVRIIEGPLLADLSGAIGAGEYFSALPQIRGLMEEKGKAICRWFKTRADDANVEADCLMETGHPLHVILDKQADVDLLILGQRGENERHGRELAGSVADRVVRRVHKPCLMVPSQFKPVTALLAGHDGTAISNKVLDIASELAMRLKVPLSVLTVAEKMDKAAAQRLADEGCKRAASTGCQASGLVKDGIAADAIIETLADMKTAMAVMGAHSHTRIREWFVGCTSLRVMADSAVPVLLVR